MKTFVFLSTSDLGDGRSAHLDRMLTSIGAAQATLKDVQLVAIILLQNAKGISQRPIFPEFVHAHFLDGRVSLSAARNILLKIVFSARALTPDTIVAFPDDDCWYPADVVEWITGQFDKNEALDFLFCRYSAMPDAIGSRIMRPRAASSRDVVREASSNTMFFRGPIVQAIGMFDETLGVGTAISGGEDTDYALSAYMVARSTHFQNNALIGHRDKLVALRAKYYPGSLLALAHHAPQNFGIAFEFLRKLFIGLYLVVRREMKISAFIHAVGLSIAAFGRGRAANTIPEIEHVKQYQGTRP